MRERRAWLAAATAARHAALDAVIREGGYFTDLAGYRRFLRRVAAARGALRVAMPAMRRAVPAVAALQDAILGAAARDLADLGEAPEDATTADEQNMAAYGWGVLYVLLGSSLGSKYLRQWAAALGVDETFGARHLALQSESARVWRDFCTDLNARDFTPDEERQCLAGAEAAFGAFEAAFEMGVLVPGD